MTNLVLFLDFDGVLHALGEPAVDDNFRLLANPNLFQWCPILEQLLAPYPEVRIVVASDWRRLFDDETLARLLGPELGSRMIGVVEVAQRSRAAEILAEARRRKLNHWLSLDDHATVVEARAAGDLRFIPCPSEQGLADKFAQQDLAEALARMLRN